MAHKTTIGGTNYKISGGKTTIGGTNYKISSGRTLINGTGYDISFKLPASLLEVWSSSAGDSPIYDIAYGNGYWVACGQYALSGQAGSARIAYATSLNGPWTVKDLWTCEHPAGCYAKCITYANGYWVVGGGWSTMHHAGSISNSTTFGTRIAYTTNPSGNWSQKNLWSGSSMNSTSTRYVNLNCITYANGYWVVGGQQCSNGYSAVDAMIARSDSPGGTWTTESVWHYTSTNNYGTRTAINDIIYANGKWTVVGNYATQSYMASKTTITQGYWAYNGSTLKNGSYTGIAYGNGHYVITKADGTIDYFDGVNAVRTIAIRGYTSTTTHEHSVIYANGLFVICGKADNVVDILYTTNPTGTWTREVLFTDAVYAGGAGSAEYFSITYENDYWVIAGKLIAQGQVAGDPLNYLGRIIYATELTDLKNAT